MHVWIDNLKHDGHEEVGINALIVTYENKENKEAKFDDEVDIEVEDNLQLEYDENEEDQPFAIIFTVRISLVRKIILFLL